MKPKTAYHRIKIKGSRLELRPYLMSDFKNLQDSHAQRLSSQNRYDGPISAAKKMDRENFKERILRYRRIAKDGHQFVFGIFDRETSKYIGQIDFLVINRQLRWGNLGYHIQNQFFGEGYATEAAQLGLRLAFEILMFHRIEAAMEPNHRDSKKVAIRAGLTFEGKRKKFFADQGGIVMIVFAENAIDFQRRKN